MANFILPLLLLVSAVAAILVGAMLGRSRVQQMAAAPAVPVRAPMQPQPAPSQSFSRREIEARKDRVEAALVMAPIRTPVTVNSLDGHTFFVTGEHANKKVERALQEIGLALGDQDFRVVAIDLP